MSDTPKADRLRQQREEKYEAEQRRIKSLRLCVDCGAEIRAGKRCKPCASHWMDQQKSNKRRK